MSIHSALAASFLLLAGYPLAAAGIAQDQRRLTPPPIVRTEAVRITAHIVDGVCDTTIAIRLRNDSAREAEQILVLPLPEGATADRLEMEVGGKVVGGEILDREKARGIYESIVSRRRDPALLEYMGRGTLRLRVFPIPPQGTQAVQVRYRMLLPESGGMHTFEFPARALQGDSVSLDITVESRQPIKNVYSPTSGMDIVRRDDHHARASIECKGSPPRDPVLFYGLSDRDFGLNLLCYRRQGSDGYFLLMAAPKRDWQQEHELSKSISFVIDTSGSMQGEKIDQAKNALRFFLQSLKPTDSFNLVPFATEARPFAAAMTAATPDKIGEAMKFVDQIEARGGTNIEEALTAALRTPPATDKVPMVVFVTDGLPTVGVTEPKDILRACEQANATHARIFVFGVGYDVNTQLLDTLSGSTRGGRDYVKPGENLEVKVSALFEQLAHPVMTEIEIVCDRIALHDMVPNKLPDMFRGSRLVVAGRYGGEGAVAVRLRGKVGGAAKEFVYDASFPAAAPEHDFVATLWAQRRVGQLLDAIRLNGRNAELVAEIRRIGKEHGIVTPYTSHLIVEEGMQITAGLRRFAGDDFGAVPQGEHDRVLRELERSGAAEGRPGSEVGVALKKAQEESHGEAQSAGRRLADLPAAVSGDKAVHASEEAKDLADDEQLRRGGLLAQRVAGRLFYLAGGIWVDAGFKPELESKLRKVEAFSADYFALLRAHPELAKIFAFSTHMIVIIGPDIAVEILPPQEEKQEPGK